MMAIGENLQEVVEKGDDICGVSCSVRFNSHLIMVWNRDGDNQKSIDKILERILEYLPEELEPQSYYVSLFRMLRVEFGCHVKLTRVCSTKNTKLTRHTD